jgi:glycosyltransferase involved in cell wall biosynthesis
VAALDKKERKPIEISAIVPLYNEQESIGQLCSDLKDALDDLNKTYEIIFIDDGSTDKTLQLLKGLANEDKQIRIISFTRNFGQTAAIAVGFFDAVGEVVVTLDGDLQNPPADIGKLLDKMEEGYDVVSGWRKNRKDPLFSRKIPSMIANSLISKITNVKLHDYGCTLKAYKRDIVKNIQLYGEMHRFIPALTGWLGARVGEVEVAHYPRRYGKSKYNLNRTFRVILDLINIKFLISYSTRPIQFFGKIGLVAFLGSGLSLLISIWMKVADNTDMSGNPLLYLTILLFLVGIQFVTLGILAEINIRIYHEMQQKPTYVIKETVN